MMLAFTLACLALMGHSAAFNALSNTSFSETQLTSTCKSALSRDLDCSPTVLSLQNGGYYPESMLNETCTIQCDRSLAQYSIEVMETCDKQTWAGYGGEQMPLAIIPDMLRYLFNLTCLMDSGRYCNVVTAAAAEISMVQESTGSTLKSLKANSSVSNTNDHCDTCAIKVLKFQAESAYFDGPLLAEHSIYQSKTSSCGVTSLPLATKTLPFVMPQSSDVPTPFANASEPSTVSCAGSSHTIRRGEDCYSVSISQRIGTAWLLTDNNLAAYCDNFPKNGTLCLVNHCDTYTLKTNDTCTTVAEAHKITETQLLAWNPVINEGCSNLARMQGSQICVSLPGAQITQGSLPQVYINATTTKAKTLAAPIPTNVAKGVSPRCSKYHTAVSGEYCNLLVMRYAISLADFLSLNAEVNSNCTNLLAEYSYCVAPFTEDTKSIDTILGQSVVTESESKSVFRYADLPAATYTRAEPVETPLPIARGTRDGCNQYFLGDDYQQDTGSKYMSRCRLAAEVFGVDLKDFARWNHGLGDVRAENCSFEKGFRYCGRYYFDVDSGTNEAAAADATLKEDGNVPNALSTARIS